MDYQSLTDRVIKAEKQHTSFASQLQQSASGQSQLKASLRSAQRQVSSVEAGQTKLQQEVGDLGQAVEQMKGRKGPAPAWQRSQEQVCKHCLKPSVFVRDARLSCSGIVNTTQTLDFLKH